MKKPKQQLGRCVFSRLTKNNKFEVRLYESGIQQYVVPFPPSTTWFQAIKERTKPRVYLERHVPKKKKRRKDSTNRRRKWMLVIRDDWSDVRRFPPIYAGPFESLELALLAWELMS